MERNCWLLLAWLGSGAPAYFAKAREHEVRISRYPRQVGVGRGLCFWFSVQKYRNEKNKKKDSSARQLYSIVWCLRRISSYEAHNSTWGKHATLRVQYSRPQLSVTKPNRKGEQKIWLIPVSGAGWNKLDPIHRRPAGPYSHRHLKSPSIERSNKAPTVLDVSFRFLSITIALGTKQTEMETAASGRGRYESRTIIFVLYSLFFVLCVLVCWCEPRIFQLLCLHTAYGTSR